MVMAGQRALVDYRKCDPKLCEGGVCAAVQACPRKLVRQEAPYDAPMTDAMPCRACGDCARSCPLAAIKVVPG
jgi:translation initiation factor RLI1